MITVVCVLRSGGEYDDADVYRLRDGVARYLPGRRFVCLTDTPPVNVEYAYLSHDWPGWWSKIELFRPGMFTGRVLYLDLDSVIVGDLSELAAYDGPFAGVRDFNNDTGLQSCVMSWTAGELDYVYRDFVPQAAHVMATMRSDQDWIGSVTRPRWLQDIVPGQLVSYKRHCKDGVHLNARVVCFHGRPKLGDLPEDHVLRRAA